MQLAACEDRSASHGLCMGCGKSQVPRRGVHSPRHEVQQKDKHRIKHDKYHENLERVLKLWVGGSGKASPVLEEVVLQASARVSEGRLLV